jgi:L-aspartate oxidase
MTTRSRVAPYALDFAVVGSGLAGLTLALRLAQHGSVALFAKADLTHGASLYAQGGIAAVLDDKDSYESHIQDTVTAGAARSRAPAGRVFFFVF